MEGFDELEVGLVCQLHLQRGAGEALVPLPGFHDDAELLDYVTRGEYRVGVDEEGVVQVVVRSLLCGADLLPLLRDDVDTLARVQAHFAKVISVVAVALHKVDVGEGTGDRDHLRGEGFGRVDDYYIWFFARPSKAEWCDKVKDSVERAWVRG